LELAIQYSGAPGAIRIAPRPRLLIMYRVEKLPFWEGSEVISAMSVSVSASESRACSRSRRSFGRQSATA
jgi:hypothetical protein